MKPLEKVLILLMFCVLGFNVFITWSTLYHIEKLQKQISHKNLYVEAIQINHEKRLNELENWVGGPPLLDRVNEQ